MSDTIRAGTIRPQRFDYTRFATTDAGGQFVIHAMTDAGVIVRGYRTDVLARIVQTGSSRRRGQVRVRFEFARDLGDVAGTLAFDGGRCGGVAPVSVFEG